MIGTTVARLRTHLRAVEERYPHAWRQLAAFREQRKELGDWPAWCYCPLAGAYAIVSGGANNRVPIEHTIDVAVVGALGAWRATQGIYRIDPTLLAALWDTPLEGDLPADLLYALPEWCVYVETEGAAPGAPAGFWAHLECDAGDGRTELRLLVDAPEGGTLALYPLILHLGHGSLGACVAAAMDEVERQARAVGAWGPETRAATEAIRHRARAWCGPFVSLLLYLCSEAAEVCDAAGSGRLPGRPQPVKTKRGLKLIAPSEPTTWEVGYHIGAALRRGQEAERGPAEGGTHARPRPHVRRAHWATYWTGPKSAPQKRVLRWLHPVLVAAERGEIEPAIHRVD